MIKTFSLCVRRTPSKDRDGSFDAQSPADQSQTLFTVTQFSEPCKGLRTLAFCNTANAHQRLSRKNQHQQIQQASFVGA
jgi:hypothetical protein